MEGGITKWLLLGGAAYLVYSYMQSQNAVGQTLLNPDGSGPVAVTAQASGQTVSTQATPVPTAPSLPGNQISSPAANVITASSISNFAALNGYPAPQSFTLWEWNYFYTKMTGLQASYDIAAAFPQDQGTGNYSASQWISGMQRVGLLDGSGRPIIGGGLSGTGARVARGMRRGVGAAVLTPKVNASYIRGAVQRSGLAPIHEW